MKDKFVYLVTPDYMLPVIEESKLYSFFIKAYPSAKVGYNNLVNTNFSSILGFVFFYEELPENLTYLVKFINLLNTIGNKDLLVVLAVNNPEGVKDYLFRKIKVDNITFKYITDFEIVTDSFIKKSIFGSIVLHNFEPYIESVTPIKEVSTFNRNEPLSSILPNDILQILSPVVELTDSDTTIKHDLVMNSSDDNGLMKYMRINYIRAHFGDSLDIEGMYKRIKAVDGINVTVYSSIISIINKLYISNSCNKTSDEYPSMLIDSNEIEFKDEINFKDVIEDNQLEDGQLEDNHLRDNQLENNQLEPKDDLFDYELMYNYEE